MKYFLLILFCFFVLSVGTLLTFLIYGGIVVDKDCLERIAKEYCEENGLVYGSSIVYNIRYWYFNCKDTERSMNTGEYKFLEEEVEECKK